MHIFYNLYKNILTFGINIIVNYFKVQHINPQGKILHYFSNYTWNFLFVPISTL
jgi:hypothetical protein